VYGVGVAISGVGLPVPQKQVVRVPRQFFYMKHTNHPLLIQDINSLPVKNFVISLIKDDLINSKLVNGLIEAGLNASQYQLHLGNTVFNLMGFEEDHYSDEVYELYIKLGRKAKDISISTTADRLDDLASEIYTVLADKLHK
jgi:hypothetical protein